MRPNLLYSAAALLFACAAPLANASTVNFTFSGPGVSGSVQLTYGTATDSKTLSGYEVTGISGTFTDSSLGLTNATILSLVPINHASPDLTNLLAPADFSKFAVASGLPAESNGVITYDNLFYPAGSPQTATDYPFHGGILDIYGLLFNVTGGDVVDLFSNGVTPGTTAPDYGVAVATSAAALDYVSGGVVVMPTPEPGTLCLLATGTVGLLLWRRPGLLGARS